MNWGIIYFSSVFNFKTNLFSIDILSVYNTKQTYNCKHFCCPFKMYGNAFKIILPPLQSSGIFLKDLGSNSFKCITTTTKIALLSLSLWGMVGA